MLLNASTCSLLFYSVTDKIIAEPTLFPKIRAENTQKDI